MIAFLTAPPMPFIPEAHQGTKMVALALCFVGPTDEGEAMIAPLRVVLEPAAEQVGPLPYRMLQGMFDASVPHGIHSYWKTEHLDELEDGVIAVAVAAAEAAASPMSQLHIHHIDGAVARGGAENTASGGATPVTSSTRSASGWNRSSPTVRSRTPGRRRRRSTILVGRRLPELLRDEGDERIRAAYGPDNERLVGQGP